MSISWHPSESATICEIAFRALLTEEIPELRLGLE
jgi:hypothetical protein